VTRFSVLGPIECWSAGRQVEVHGALQRTLLATLLASEGKPVPAEPVAMELWAGSPPRNWENALQAHVSRLRRRLAAIADERPASLVVAPGGYRLLVVEDAVDALVFMRKFTRARVLAASDPAAAVGELRSALALWRGPALGNVIGGPVCRSAAARYEAARVVGLETMFDLELQTGRHIDIIPALSELVESPALNERFCEQLMIALYRCGLQTEALATYRRMRHRLDMELGVQPTRTLRNHEKAILAHDPSLRLHANHAALRD
jgi:SARP family transcriptional regulator, regulator of embCAB operon